MPHTLVLRGLKTSSDFYDLGYGYWKLDTIKAREKKTPIATYVQKYTSWIQYQVQSCNAVGHASTDS